MLLQVNCAGYVKSQYMQHDASKYSYGPNIEAKTFMMPEQEFYAHHPGRFFYIKEENKDSLISIPFAPVKSQLESFEFSVGQNDICWRIKHGGLKYKISLQLAKEDVVELWSLKIINQTNKVKKINVYPYFSIGYMSWMNQSASFSSELNGIIASSIAPYQKTEDYYKQKDFKDLTFLLSNKKIDSYCAQLAAFEGTNGLHNPEALKQEILNNDSANYQTPAAILHHHIEINPKKETQLNYLFGPAKDIEDVKQFKRFYFEQNETASSKLKFDAFKTASMTGPDVLQIETPDPDFDRFVNQWLPRQVYYHGRVNRMTSDPQTRNYLQDNLGMCYLDSNATRHALVKALSQQFRSGAMPDGILLNPKAELKYINQIPHTDHCVWLPLLLEVYLDEMNDYQLLEEKIPYADCSDRHTVREHIERSIIWLVNARDERGLSYIEQGDWCDPMNMVGVKGIGVSSWLSVATAYSLNVWAKICRQSGKEDKAEDLIEKAQEINKAVNDYCWIDGWYARGITDNGRVFGTSDDEEGKIYLNPQSWAMLSGAADSVKMNQLLEAIEANLETPDGVMMLAPSYTQMVEDIGRITQKFPGVAENGSVYNHAAAFYAYSLYQQNYSDKAFRVLRTMIPDGSNIERRGQLPLFVPNYYRGAYHQLPEVAGRSSQLINTGTTAWYYRCVIENLCGLKGSQGDLLVNPQLPSHWNIMQVTRRFKEATFNMQVERDENVVSQQVYLDNKLLDTAKVTNIQPGKEYQLRVLIPIVNENKFV
ncbi:NdvB protein [Aliikangiella marina]|uniref:NdvB protein n=2 Tax=Aliikangiella marina TaxID=1712262 RepID=A0A545T1P5_9GAMM|nr:NdvB protein [Aliikangiella marina]